jgi:hypothetical protein
MSPDNPNNAFGRYPGRRRSSRPCPKAELRQPMAMIVCPNCGYGQQAGEKCRKCSTLFSYYQKAGSAPGVPRLAQATAQQEKRPQGFFRRAYRVWRWVSLSFLILVLVLILHRAPPPPVAFDPQAAARAEAKINSLQRETLPGPRELSLDETELNSYLHKNLDLNRENDTENAAPGDTAPRSGPKQPGTAPAPPAVPAPPPDPTVEEMQSSVKDVRITMLEDRIRAYVLFDFHGKDLSLQLEGRLRVENGYLRFEPVSGALGSLPLPESALQNAISRMMASPENRERLRVPDEIRNIHIQNGELIVDYR